MPAALSSYVPFGKAGKIDNSDGVKFLIIIHNDYHDAFFIWRDFLALSARRATVMLLSTGP